MDNQPLTRTIVYKGKPKEIPFKNADPKLCEFYIIARMRYCKFEKHENTEFCIYHRPNEEDNILFVDCPIDNSHRVLASKLKKHVKVCNKLGEKQRLVANPWYKEKINLVQENEELIKKHNLDKEEVEKLYELKWEELDEEEYSRTLDKIIEVYNILKEDYKNYSQKENLEDILIIKNKLQFENYEIDRQCENIQKLKVEVDSKKENNLEDEGSNNNTILNFDYIYQWTLSGLNINLDKVFLFTKDLAKSEKNGKQNTAIGNVMKNFDLLDYKNIYTEFGAGKGGLSYYINNLTKNNSLHILLEREGVRYKRDKFSQNLIRVKFYLNINYF